MYCRVARTLTHSTLASEVRSVGIERGAAMGVEQLGVSPGKDAEVAAAFGGGGAQGFR